MGGTVAGGKRASVTNKKKYGDQFYRDIAIESQKAYMSKPKEERKPRGFAAVSPEKRKEAGRIGGLRSRRLSKQQIKEIIDSDLGVTELSKKYGVSRNTIYKYRNGN